MSQRSTAWGELIALILAAPVMLLGYLVYTLIALIVMLSAVLYGSVMTVVIVGKWLLRAIWRR